MASRRDPRVVDDVIEAPVRALDCLHHFSNGGVVADVEAEVLITVAAFGRFAAAADDQVALPKVVIGQEAADALAGAGYKSDDAVSHGNCVAACALTGRNRDSWDAASAGNECCKGYTGMRAIPPELLYNNADSRNRRRRPTPLSRRSSDRGVGTERGVF